MDPLRIYSDFPTEGAFADAFIQYRFGGEFPFCVHCGGDDLLRINCKLFRCRPCRKKFSIYKDTLLANSKIDVRKWIYALLKLAINGRKGISSCELARDINVSQKTAWSMEKKIRERMGRQNARIDDLSFVTEVVRGHLYSPPRGHLYSSPSSVVFGFDLVTIFQMSNTILFSAALAK